MGKYQILSPDLCGTKCVDFKADPLNCGACAHDCTSLANVKAGAAGIECRSGVCYVPPSACATGFAHCSTRSDDGCETNLATTTNCGKCGTACVAPTALCSTTTGAPACSSSCVAPSPDLCGSRCVDFKSDPANCGSCGHDCGALPNVKAGATVQCVAGVCSIPPTSCVSGFAHCAGSPDLGCEASLSSPLTCGSCTTKCTAPTALCSTTSGAPMCSSSCVAPAPDLCSTKCVDLKTDPTNCGTCGFNCGALPNVKPGASVQCVSGVCSIPATSCVAGFAHCAGSGNLGCETNLSVPATCGSCTNKCVAPTALCSTTTGVPMCSSSCVSPAPDLCTTKCVDLKTDPLNCGTCGFNCGSLPNVKLGASVQCVSGVCSIPSTSCAAGFAHCAGSGNLGCETNLSLPATCGSCTIKCVAPTANCSPSPSTGLPVCSSSCVSPTPNLCTQSCVNLQADSANCGTCGHNCATLTNVQAGAPVSCVSGVCVIPPTSCKAGTAHCSGSGDLGCETSITVPTSCGSCTNRCVAPTANCSPTASGTSACSSSCVTPTPDLCNNAACVNLQTDPLNCGSCNHNCTTLTNVRTSAGVTCVAGSCVVPQSACTSGFAHCAGSPDLGCETRTNTATNCAACGVPCNAVAGASASCASGACVQTCNDGLADCTTAAGCETSITTAQACGSCTNTCAAASCTATAAGVTFVPAATCSTARTCTAGVATTCGGFGCASATACAGTCSASLPCAPGFFCSGTTCLAKRAIGGVCSLGGDCTSGNCIGGICCSTSCPLAATGCMTCATGTCAARAGSATQPCPTANPTACVNLQTDRLNCNTCGNVCSVALPTGGAQVCAAATCTAGCATPANSICTVPAVLSACVPLHWGFEPSETQFWGNNDDNSSTNSTLRPRTGTQSLAVTPNSIPSLPASVGVFGCTDAAQVNIGTLDLRGKTFTAFIFVPSSPGSFFDSTSCKLAAADPSFTRVSILGTGASVAPIPQATFFTLTGTFANTALESRVRQIIIECILPPDWRLDDPSKQWFIDDVTIQ